MLWHGAVPGKTEFKVFGKAFHFVLLPGCCRSLHLVNLVSQSLLFDVPVIFGAKVPG